MAAKRKPPAPARFAEPDPTVQPLLSAAGLLVAVLKKTKLADIDDLVAAGRDGVLPAGVALSSQQAQLLEAHYVVLSCVTASVTVAVCQACGEHLYLSTSSSPPTKCSITLRCGGKVVKAKAARRA